MSGDHCALPSGRSGRRIDRPTGTVGAALRG